MKTIRLLIVLALAILFLATSALVAAEKPSSVIHVINAFWKEGTTEAQIQEAMAGLEAAAKTYPGITRIWLKPIKVQGNIGDHPVAAVIVMEFADQDALKKYAGSDAQKKFYEKYMAIRGESRTCDITN
jgi:hypothetical protein